MLSPEFSPTVALLSASLPALNIIDHKHDKNMAARWRLADL
jgi:hypothetical protein